MDSHLAFSFFALIVSLMMLIYSYVRGRKRKDFLEKTLWLTQVQAKRELLPGGVAAYELTHDDVGNLGRILIEPVPTGGWNVRHEVWDESDDGLRPKRIEILAVVKKSVMDGLTKAQAGKQ